MTKTIKSCPCQSKLSYSSCCGQFITGQALPYHPEQLMRSRYTAYTQANIAYIQQTMRSTAAEGYDAATAKQWAKNVKWQELKILSSTHNGTVGQVEFIACFSESGKPQSIHEISDFQRIDGSWYYIDGKRPLQKQMPVKAEAGPNRNDSCPCGSGKKYKKCCLQR